MRPVVVALAGSDPTSGAGMQMDLKAIEANGARAATAVTAITAQNSRGVRGVWPLTVEQVAGQLDAVLEDHPVRVVKVGMIGSAAVAEFIADTIERREDLDFVVDPVLEASSGGSLAGPAVLDCLRERIAVRAAVITPNLSELAALSRRPVPDRASALEAARFLVDRGSAAVVVTGGHCKEDRGTDLLVTATMTESLHGPWIETADGHGTGCAFASALAARLACGETLVAAARTAKVFVARTLERRKDLRAGCP